MMIPYARQNITQADIDAVVRVLQSDFLTQGEEVPKFEQKVCEKLGVKYAFATTNATNSLHLVYKALGLEAGQWLWTTPITFVATSNAALYLGAKVKFIDIDLETFNISPEKLALELEAAAKTNQLPKILACVHIAGNSVDMQKIKQLAQKYDFKIVEDSAHAMGGVYQNYPVGSCEYSDACVFSFHPVKIITTGEGGMITTNDADLANKIAILRNHGVTRQGAPKDELWMYDQLYLGFNYRMTEMQAALGASQLARLDTIIEKRNAIAKSYSEKLANLPIKLPKVAAKTLSAWHLYVVHLANSQQRKFVFNFMRAKNIGVNLHYIPVPTQPFYRELGYNMDSCPNAQAYYKTCLSLPLYPELDESQIDYIVETLTQALQSAP